MSNASCSADEINQFVGWKTGTMMNYYADARSFALNSVTPYLLAGRKSKDDSPAAAWHFFDKIDTSQIWCLRIATVARVNFDCFPVHDSIKRRIDSYQAKVDKGELTTSIEQLQRKRIRQLELKVERLTKMHRFTHDIIQEVTLEDHEMALVSMLDELVKKVRRTISHNFAIRN